MLLSIALIIIIGFALGGLFKKLHIPSLLGMLIAGILLGPHVLNLISPSILHISDDLREIALIVILVRAGLTLDIKDLKKVGRPAILMCFVPATFEIVGAIILGPLLLGISVVDAAIIGAMLAAVSPAVIVPKMIDLIEKRYGRRKSVPQLIMAGASADDIYAIVLFTAFIGVAKGGEFDAGTLLVIPLSIVLGVAFGILGGLLLVVIFKRIHMRDTVKVLLILGAAILLVGVEPLVFDYVPFSGLLAAMALGATVLKAREKVARRITGKFSKIWVAAELILFVLLGAAVDVRFVLKAGVAAVLLIIGAFLVRTIGTWVSLIRSGLNKKEKLFCVIAYLPKATVQAAVGAIPLSLGLASGNIILSIAVLSILITAPIGAIGIDRTYRRLLDAPGDASTDQ
ncbi:MAG: cation:proton antiporter [Clostridiales bacterium]|nr:cation:proton antiporter [Clostridiales bacterium]